ncbi:Rap1a/Tai family immunity protein [Rhizobium leguminosarum]
MKRAILVSCAVFAAGYADAMDAKELAGFCEKDISYAGAYISGFLDTWRENELAMVIVKNEVKDERAVKTIRQFVVGKFCIPPKANVALGIRVACDWVETHPEMGDIRASRAIFNAYNAAWPCIFNQ